MVELGFKNRQQAEFARLIGISASYLNDIINKKKGPSSELFFGIAANFHHVNINWLLTGEGEMFRKDRNNIYIKGEKYSQDLQSGNVNDRKGIYIKEKDPEISDLVKMTQEILKSETDYAFSLAASIKSFHKSVLMERQLTDHEQRLRKIEAEK